MKHSLSPDWFVEGVLDFEYKKYVLLAWLQQVQQEFAQVKLYPALADLVFQYNNLTGYRENRQRIAGLFPARLDEAEFRRLNLAFQAVHSEGADLEEINAIVDYAIPIVHEHLREGKDLYDHIDTQLLIEPVGITPLYKQEGYIFLRISTSREVRIFQYRITFFENADVQYHGITLQYVDAVTVSLVQTVESLKLDLIRTYTQLPNPATYLLVAPAPYPEEASLIPIAKRKLLAYLR
ncbi:MAG: hypothetical protein SF053_22100 [Bacteroidia bacterium]|nr:hypothetical protein [Bacteroidia bacterium]